MPAQQKLKNIDHMKTTIPITKLMAVALAVLAIGIWVAVPSPAAAQEKGAAAAKLIKQTSAQTSVTTATVKKGDKPANWCSKCKISQVRVTERPTKTGATPESKLITRNECSECVNVAATTGTGKLAQTTFANSCEACCKLDPDCCVKNPICCIVNAGVLSTPLAAMVRN